MPPAAGRSAHRSPQLSPPPSCRAGAVTGDLVTDLVEPEDPPPRRRPDVPAPVTDGASAVTWPATDWAHRPCRGCLVVAARESRRVVRRATSEGADPVPPGASSALAAITRTVVAGEVAGQTPGLALEDDAAAAPSLAADGHEGHPSDALVLRRGLARTRLAPDPGCLCAPRVHGRLRPLRRAGPHAFSSGSDHRGAHGRKPPPERHVPTRPQATESQAAGRHGASHPPVSADVVRPTRGPRSTPRPGGAGGSGSPRTSAVITATMCRDVRVEGHHGERRIREGGGRGVVDPHDPQVPA